MNWNLLARRWVLLGVISCLAACASKDERRDVRLVTDSAGVETVRLRFGADPRAPEAALDSLPAVAIGVAAGDAALELSGVVGAVRLSDGTIVVANSGTRELRYFAPDGSPLGAAGRRGEGPGEFGSIGWIGVAAGDNVLAYDDRLQRISRFDRDGRFLGAQRLIGALLPYVAGALDRATLGSWQFGGEDDDRLGVYTADVTVGLVELADGEFRPAATLPSSEEARVQYRGRLTRAFRPFGRTTDVAAGGGFLYVLASSDDRHIRVYDAQGALRRTLTVEVPARRVNASLVEAWADSWIARFSGGSPDLEEWWRHGFAATPAPDHVPLFRSLEVDARGNVCAEHYPLQWWAETRYWCFSPDGHFVGVIRLPAGLVRRGPHPHFDPQLEIGERYVLGVWQDELGSEQVRQYGIAW